MLSADTPVLHRSTEHDAPHLWTPPLRLSARRLPQRLLPLLRSTARLGACPLVPGGSLLLGAAPAAGLPPRVALRLLRKRPYRPTKDLAQPGVRPRGAHRPGGG